MKVRRCFLGGLWILSLIAISFYGGAVSYGFFFGVTLVPVISFFYLLCVLFRFKIYQEAEKKSLVCGQPSPYLFVLQNEDLFAYTGIGVRMYSDFSHAEDDFENAEYELLPGDKCVCETRIVCKYRGEYEIGVKEVVLTDFFRLFRLRYAVSGQIKASVLPRIVRLSELKSISDLPMPVQSDASGSREPDVVVRDHAEGDSLKQVHWKATARERRLKVRVMTGRENLGIALFCDTRRYSGERDKFLPLENKILEVFLAVGCYFADADKAFTAYYGQRGVVKKRVEGLEDLDGFYHEVSGIAFDPEEDLRSVLEQAAGQGILWGSRLVFCVLHEPDPALLDLTERLTASGTVVVIYAVTDRDPGAYAGQGSTRRRIVVIPVEAELEGRL